MLLDEWIRETRKVFLLKAEGVLSAEGYGVLRELYRAGYHPLSQLQEFTLGTGRVCLVTGDAGIGKTFLCHQLISQVCQVGVEREMVPVYVSITKQASIPTLSIEDIVRAQGVSEGDIPQLKAEGRLLIILDGFADDERYANLFVSLKLYEWPKAKIVVTCRSLHLFHLSHYSHYFEPLGPQGQRLGKLTEIKLPLLSEAQLKPYQQHTQAHPELRELLRHPFFLQCVIRNAEVPSSDLVERLLRAWFTWHESRFREMGRLSVNETLGDKSFGYGIALAWQMRKTNVDAIVYKPRSMLFQTEDASGSAFFSRHDSRLNLLREMCPLVEVGSKRYQFLAQSLLSSYFADHRTIAALSLQEETVVKPRDVGEVPRTEPMPANPPNGLSNHYLNKRCMTDDSNIMQWFADRVVESTKFKELLFKLVLASRTDATMETAAANAITILNRAGVSFSGLDLSGIRIVNANLSWAICHHTNFKGANLKNVNFYHAFLDNANFKGADLTGIYIDEDRGIFLRKYYSSLMSPDSRYLIINEDERLAHWYEFASRKKLRTIKNYDKAVFSPDSKQIVIFYKGFLQNNSIEWIDCTTQQLIMKLNNKVDTVVFSPDSQLLLCSNGDNTRGRIVDWYSCRDRVLLEQIKISKRIHNVIFSPNVKQVLLCCGGDYDETFWYDAATRRKLTMIGDKVSKIIFSPDSKQVVFCGHYGTWQQAHWYECASQHRINDINQTRPVDAEFSLDSNYLVLYSRDELATLYDCRTQQLLLSVDLPENVFISPNSQYIIFCCTRQAVWYHIKSQRLLLKLEICSSKALFSTDNRYVVMCGQSDGSSAAYLFDIATQKQVAELNGVNNTILSPDNQQLVCWGSTHFYVTDIYKESTQRFEIKIGNVAFNKEQQLLFTTTDCCYVLNRGDDSYHLVYSSANYIQLVISHPLQNTFICVLEGGCAFWCLQMTVTAEPRLLITRPSMSQGHVRQIRQMDLVDNRYLFSMGGEGNIWYVRKDKLQHLFNIENTTTYYPIPDFTDVIFTGEKYYDGSAVCYYKIKERTLIPIRENSKLIMHSSVSKKERKCHYDRNALGRMLILYPSINSQIDAVDAFVISPDRKYIGFYCSNLDGLAKCAVYLFELVSRKLHLKLEGNNTDIVFSPDSKHVMFYASNPLPSWRRAFWYEIETKQLLTIEDGIRNILFSPDGKSVVFYNNNFICPAYWHDLQSRKLILKTTHNVRKVIFSPNGQHIFFYQTGESVNPLAWFDVEVARLVMEFDSDYENMLFFDNDHQMIIYSYRSPKSFWYNAVTKELLAALNFQFSKITLSVDGRHIIFHGDYEGIAYWYDVLTHQLIHQTPNEIRDVVFPPDGQQLIFYSNKFLYWYNVQSRQLTLKLENIDMFIMKIVFLPNCREFLLLAIDCGLWIDIATQVVLVQLGGWGEKTFITPNNRYLIIYDKKAYCYDLQSRKQLVHIEGDDINSVELVKDRYIIFHGVYKHFFDLMTKKYGKLNCLVAHTCFFEAPAVEAIPENLAKVLHLITTGKDDHTLRLWDLSNLRRPLLVWSSAGMSFSSRGVRGISTAKGLSQINCRFFENPKSEFDLNHVEDSIPNVTPTSFLGSIFGNIQCAIV